MQLGDDGDRGQRVDAAKAPQPGHRFRVRRVRVEFREASVEIGEPRLHLIDRQEIVANDVLFGRVIPRQRLQPDLVRTRPVAPSEMEPAPEEQLLRRSARVVTGPDQITRGFGGGW